MPTGYSCLLSFAVRGRDDLISAVGLDVTGHWVIKFEGSNQGCLDYKIGALLLLLAIKSLVPEIALSLLLKLTITDWDLIVT